MAAEAVSAQSLSSASVLRSFLQHLPLVTAPAAVNQSGLVQPGPARKARIRAVRPGPVLDVNSFEPAGSEGSVSQLFVWHGVCTSNVCRVVNFLCVQSENHHSGMA